MILKHLEDLKGPRFMDRHFIDLQQAAPLLYKCVLFYPPKVGRITSHYSLIRCNNGYWKFPFSIHHANCFPRSSQHVYVYLATPLIMFLSLHMYCARKWVSSWPWVGHTCPDMVLWRGFFLLWWHAYRSLLGLFCIPSSSVSSAAKLPKREIMILFLLWNFFIVVFIYTKWCP